MLRQILTGLIGFSAVLSAIECDYSSNLWLRAEYLLWEIQDAPKVIPLVIEGAEVEEFSPLFGEPGTCVLLGNKKINHRWRSGGRFTLGYWFNANHCIGAEANYFFLAKETSKKCVFSNGLLGSPFLAFPFIDTVTGLESSIALSRPSSFEGSASLKVSNQMQGAEINAVSLFGCFNSWDINLLGGFRYLNFTEKLNFNTSSPFIDPTVENIYFTRDKFHMSNHFYGAQIGANLDFNYCDLLVNVKAKLAVGAIHQSSKIKGELFLNDFTNFTFVQEFQGGYLALPSSIGHRKKTRCSIIPEINLNLGYKVTEAFAIQMGYNFFYVTNVLRASKQVSREINPTQSALFQYTPTPTLVNEALPTGHLRSSNLWVQGFNLGLEFIY